MKYIIGHYRKCDFITMLGTSLSMLGIILAIRYHFTISAFCLLCSGICDAFDGKIARKYKYSKEKNIYGIQLDSLSDMICFGAFPMILVNLISNSVVTFVISLFYLLCGMIRLAYFNTKSVMPNSKKNVFIGVPITTSAVILPVVIFIFRFLNFSLLVYILPILLLILAISYILKVEIKKPNIELILQKVFNKYVVNFILFPILITIFSDLLWKMNGFDGKAYIDIFTTIKFNFLPFLFIAIIFSAVTILLTALFNDTKKAKISILIFVALLLFINDIKYKMMNIPIQLIDIWYLNPENVKMMKCSTSTAIGMWLLKPIAKLAFMIIICIILSKIDKFHNFKFKKSMNRIICSILSLIIIILPFLFINSINKFLLKNIYRMKEQEILTITDVTGLYYEKGYFQAMYLNKMGNFFVMPDDYDINKAKKILSNIDKNHQKGTWKKSNVVVLLSETFSDPQLLEGIEYDQELMPNIKQYAKDDDKIVTDLLVNPYGGVSVNSEFEILTGASLNFFNYGFIPYTQYYSPQHIGKNQSLISEFKKNGYSTLYLTPWGRDSYKSESTYSILGVDEKIYGDQLNGNKYGIYYSDKSLMSDIYNRLKKTDKNKKQYQFIMAASAENHNPYSGKYKDNEYDIDIKNSSFDEETTSMYRSYGQGIHDADKALKQLYNYIKKLDTPTIVVMFGDHHPFMTKKDGTSDYLKNGYFNTENKDINDLRLHTTKGVILANYKLDIDDLNYINLSYLGAYVLNKMNINTSDYFKMIDYTRKIVPVFNKNGVYNSSKKEFIDMTKISNKQKKALSDYKFIQYYKFYDYNK